MNPAKWVFILCDLIKEGAVKSALAFVEEINLSSCEKERGVMIMRAIFDTPYYGKFFPLPKQFEPLMVGTDVHKLIDLIVEKTITNDYVHRDFENFCDSMGKFIEANCQITETIPQLQDILGTHAETCTSSFCLHGPMLYETQRMINLLTQGKTHWMDMERFLVKILDGFKGAIHVIDYANDHGYDLFAGNGERITGVLKQLAHKPEEEICRVLGILWAIPSVRSFLEDEPRSELHCPRGETNIGNIFKLLIGAKRTYDRWPNGLLLAMCLVKTGIYLPKTTPSSWKLSDEFKDEIKKARKKQRIV